ncbi:MAG: hypothetical protein LBE22_00200 [Azoarcus sp.]|jgi:hypothetical protein|nr:hypothetical protein [Azoarcus sp.]
MQFKTIFLPLAGSLLLSACATSFAPYVSPPPGTPVARFRVVSNSTVTGQVYSGCAAKGNSMTNARYGRPKEPTSRLDMPPRLAPDLTGVPWLGTKPYNEETAEYLVPAGVPFMLEWTGQSSQVGNFISTCTGRRKIYHFEENKDYEAYIGMTKERKCVFVVYQLPPASPESDATLSILIQNVPIPVPIMTNALIPAPIPEPEGKCKTQQ